MNNIHAKNAIYWFCTDRTSGEFLKGIKNRLNVIEHYNHKESNYSSYSVIRFFQIIRVFKKSVTELVIDGFSIQLLLLTLISNRMGIRVVMRLRGGMNGEFNDSLLLASSRFRWFRVWVITVIRNKILKNSDIIMPVSVFCKSQVLYELPEIDIDKIHVLIKPTTLRDVNENINESNHKLTLPEMGQENKTVISTIAGFNYGRKCNAISFYGETILNVLKIHSNCMWLIAGDGPGLEKVKTFLESKIKSLGIQQQVLFLGYIENVPELLLYSDIVFNPTFRDSAPEVVKEAQLLSLPICLNRSSCGPIEFIPDNHLAQQQIFETKDELHRVMNNLIKDNNIREEIGRRNHEFAIGRYSMEKIINQFVKIISEKVSLQKKQQ